MHFCGSKIWSIVVEGEQVTHVSFSESLGVEKDPLLVAQWLWVIKLAERQIQQIRRHQNQNTEPENGQ